MGMELYSYFRSSTAYRVRIGLNMKGLEYKIIPVNLLKGEQRSPDYSKVNASRSVPALRDGAHLFTQSLAILEYLDEVQPVPAFLPSDAVGRARVRSLAQLVACDIHPVNNLRILKYITGELGLDEEAKLQWIRHWVAEGFEAFEHRLREEAHTGDFCHGDTPGLADICLVPQVFNAARFGCDLSPYPTLMAIHERASALPAFADAHPDNQPDKPAV